MVEREVEGEVDLRSMLRRSRVEDVGIRGVELWVFEQFTSVSTLLRNLLNFSQSPLGRLLERGGERERGRKEEKREQEKTEEAEWGEERRGRERRGREGRRKRRRDIP